jgi:hypothetical protein
MALENTDEHYPAQWNRLIEGDAKSPAWGNPIPLRSALSGKTAEEIRFWAANCTAKIAFYLQKIPDDPAQNDGYWEVRVFWHHKRKTWLLEQAATLQTTPCKTPIRPLLPTSSVPNRINLGGWPGGQPVSFTKKSELERENGAGSIQPGEQEESANPPSPTVLLEEVLAQPHWPTLDVKKMIQPFKRPRPTPQKEEEKEPEPPPRRSKREKKKPDLYCDEEL